MRGEGTVLDLNKMLQERLERGASDLHITVGVPPMIRRNGALTSLGGSALTSADTRELVYSILSGEQRAALEREWEFDFAYSLPGCARFRVNTYFQRNSVGAAFRAIPMQIRSFGELGLPAIVADLALRARGLVLVTGPTGSGKTTTLATIIDHINHNCTDHIITIEDPIEYLHQHGESVVNQREVGADTRSFSAALKYILRQDPDVIMIGEMRDLETVAAALTAAETGHLVFATLHTQDAAQTVDRIIDVFPPHQQQQVRVQLASSLQGVVSQQLLPIRDGSGRTAAVEVLVPTPAVRNLIREGKTHQIPTAIQTGTQHGMTSMDNSLATLYKRGMITLDTALQRAIDVNVLKQLTGTAD